MTRTTLPANVPPPAAAPKKRRLGKVPIWGWILIAIVASSLFSLGVPAIQNYVVDHTTVSVSSGAWAVPVGGGQEYSPMCGWGGVDGGCPSRVSPGSDYATSISLSSYFAGKNVALSAPSPFRILSTNPTLPVQIPSSGITISVDLGLPSTPGVYSFLGTVSFS